MAGTILVATKLPFDYSSDEAGAQQPTASTVMTPEQVLVLICLFTSTKISLSYTVCFNLKNRKPLTFPLLPDPGIILNPRRLHLAPTMTTRPKK
jgi:hypothetical protein